MSKIAISWLVRLAVGTILILGVRGKLCKSDGERSVLIDFLEASHAKYNYTTTGLLVIAATYIVTCAVYILFVSYINNESLNKNKFTDYLSVSSVVVLLCTSDYFYVCERRADVEGCYATQCADYITELVSNDEAGLICQCAEQGYDLH